MIIQQSNMHTFRKASGSVARAILAALMAGWIAAGSVVPARAQPATYTFDRQHTNVTFSWNHLGLSRQSGRVLDVDGSLVFDAANPEDSKLDVAMKAASIVTGVIELDRHLKSPDFFDAVRNPLITFKSTAVKKTGEKTGEVTGDLTILGISKPVVLQVTLNFDGEHPLGPVNALYKDKFVAGFSAKARLSRSEWGLSRATPLVSDEIEISIETELNRKP
jgi:polyisoprenoid-binding protein YceI